VAGFEIPGEARGLRARIGYMSQRFSLYDDLTVAENIELFAGLYGVVGERFAARRAWTLQMAGLAGREDRVTGDLPLGWKQRLALGCAVLHEPPLLFLDEPTSGVDPMARRAFWDLIYELAGAGTTVLVSTHYMEEAEYCHRLLLMHRGRVIAEGTPAGLRALVSEPIYALHTRDAAAAAQALAGAPGVVEAALFGRDLHVVLDLAGTDPAQVRAALAAQGHEVEGMEAIEASLEDVFVALVRRQGSAVPS
jgi:ABC-2 type transport system ATP-binding protein